MTRPILRPGDEFATRNPTILGKLIRCVQKAQAADNEATYNHTGIITDPHGATLEALWTTTAQNIWDDYKGERVLIVRNLNMTLPTYAAGFNKIRKHIGQWYPVPRLILHMVGLAKFVHWDRVVCSELTAKFETGCAEYREGKETGFLRNWYGVNPDDLTDRWRISRYYRTIFEGVAE
jgi:hypothetical protein